MKGPNSETVNIFLKKIVKVNKLSFLAMMNNIFHDIKHFP